MKARNYLLSIFIFLCILSVNAQVSDCNCTDMIYLNDEDRDEIHKFSIDAGMGSVSEIGSPWLPSSAGVTFPHGIAIDLNGYVYVSRAPTITTVLNWDSHFEGGKAFKMTSDGTVINPDPNPTAIDFTLSPNEWGANYGTENGILYMPNNLNETVDAYSLCTGDYIGSMGVGRNTPGGPLNDVQTWGFYVENGKWYWPNMGALGRVYSGDTDISLYNATATNNGAILFNHLIPVPNPLTVDDAPLGITRDDAGNFYIVRGHINGTGPARIRKYDAAGTFISEVTDNSNGGANATNGQPGFWGARGIAYSSASGLLYVGSFENCIAVFNTNLVQQTALNIGNPMAGKPKGIGILTECCPAAVNQTFNQTVCSNGNGERIFLQDVLSCDGTIVEGTWVEVSNTSGGAIVYNACDLSITVNGSGCATYTLTKNTAATGNQQCGAYTITLTVCTQVPSATVTAVQGTCAGSTPNNDAVVNITAAMNADQAGISMGATYSGPAYSGVGTIDISSGSGSFTGLAHNTQYTVRVYNGSNDCYVDYTLTTPDVICCALDITCTPQPQTNCTPVNGSANVNVTGAVGTVTYLWSSGEVTSSISNKAAGTYTVTVTDGGVAGCSRTCQAVITNNTTNPNVSCDKTDNTNCSTPNGTATATATGVTYLWSNNATTAMITGLAAGTYTVTVTSTTTGCINTCQSVVANATVSPTCNITVNSQPSCANLTGGDITVVPSPVGTYTYNWNDIGSGAATRTGLTGGSYTVTVTNTTTNCTGVCSVTLITPTNCCNINAIIPQNLECLDNGTPALITDNRIRFSAQVTNTNASLTAYNVTINGGTTITPNTNVPYGITQFTLGAGTAGGGATFTVTVTDSATPGCTQTFQILDPGDCNNAIQCPTPNCGTATIQVNGN
jgi:hypothetical protein